MCENIINPGERSFHGDGERKVFPIRLPVFEGPLDLLLHLVKINELDIYDIPIAEVTRQYMDYLEWMKFLELDIAGDFLLMAATLAHIKSRMLLPPEKPSEKMEELETDPRMQLVQQLLQYKKFKEIAHELKRLEEEQSRVWTRGKAESSGNVDILEISIFDLVHAVSGIISRLDSTKVTRIEPSEIKIEQEMERIIQLVQKTKSILFQDIFKDAHGRLKIIGTFLAVLELVRLRKIRVYQAKMFGDIYLSWRDQ